jgi:hypothetical protein
MTPDDAAEQSTPKFGWPPLHCDRQTGLAQVQHTWVYEFTPPGGKREAALITLCRAPPPYPMVHACDRGPLS